MQCPVIVYVNDLQVINKDETSIAGVIETLKDKYHYVQEYTGVKHSYLEMSLGMSVTGVCALSLCIFSILLC